MGKFWKRNEKSRITQKIQKNALHAEHAYTWFFGRLPVLLGPGWLPNVYFQSVLMPMKPRFAGSHIRMKKDSQFVRDGGRIL